MLLTVEDMVAVFGEVELQQLAGAGPRDERVLDRPKIEEAIAHASALVLGYVRDRWPGAGTGTPMLKGFCADIARWRLRGRGGQQAAMSDVIEKRYEQAMACLKDLAAGRLTLDLPADAPGAALTPAASNETRILAVMPGERGASILVGYAP